MRSARWYLAAALLLIPVVFWLLTNYAGSNSKSLRAQPRTLDSYREEFRRPDGKLPDDMELRNILIAKGIPFVEPPHESKGTARQRNDSISSIANLPEIEYRQPTLSASQREILRMAIRDNLGHKLSEWRNRMGEIRLERIVVDEQQKLQLYFSREFSNIADDEGLLNDFSESLNDLGMAGLRGATLFIGGKPLGEYLQALDLQRNREAKLNSQITGSDTR